MIAIRGAHSKIAQAFVGMNAPDKFTVVARDEPMPLDVNRYLFCQGVLYGKSAGAMSEHESCDTWMVNCGKVMQDCDRILANNIEARICIIGSESGFAGSFDSAYAASKAGLHRYVETKRLRYEEQQLVCIAPGIIQDSGMTERRRDFDTLNARRNTHPKRRFLWSKEVARFAYFLLYEDTGYLSGVVIRMNGGDHTCR